MNIAERLADAAIRSALAERRPPGATYRLQMHGQFTFRDAERVVPYLDALGITHLYLSPILAAKPGSTHGYDVIDPTSLNPEIGSEAEFRELVAAVRARGMGFILDVVPNHMHLGPENPWWRDVFEHGPSSPYAGYFDIAWEDSPRADLHGRVMLPILGEPYYQVLESGELKLDLENGAFVIRYYDTTLPVDPRTYDQVLKPALDQLAETPDVPPDAAAELQSIATAVRNLPSRTETDPERVREGRAETEVIKRRIAALVDTQPTIANCLSDVIARFHCKSNRAEACDRLNALLDAQTYRLCFWRVASDEINYRRFFDINQLSALSAEREDVFRDTHALILRLIGEGLIDGLRIDHPDGLFDPKQYLDRLQLYALLARARHAAETDSPFHSVEWAEVEQAVRERLTEWLRHNPPPLYVIVEKILERSEQLPADWATAGTTGYQFINAVNGLFVDPTGQGPLTIAYEDFTGRDDPFSEVVYRQKMLVLHSSFASELEMLARQLDRLARKNRRARDFTLNGIRQALRAVIASFPVYRSYITDHVSPIDDRLIRLAVFRSRRRTPTLSQELFDFIRDTLLLKPPPETVPDTYAAEQERFVGKFQQVTAPVTAKGVEDTAFYRYFRLVSLNEVGGDPARFGWPPADVHTFLSERQAHYPGALSAGSTHDTKRGEDVRTRIDVISERADEWTKRVRHWAELNRPHKIELEEGFIAPDANDEYLLYQTLLGAWPTDADTPGVYDQFVDRIRAYMVKAIHEAKEHTSWINPNPEYDAAVPEFVSRILDPARSAAFLDDLRQFQQQTARFGVFNSLAQTLLRCAAPGVPDTYQGTELWDLSLVDPDNRRPVDYPRRETLLNKLDRDVTAAGENLRAFAGGLLDRAADGRIKLYVVSRALRQRRAAGDLFRDGAYQPVEASGPKAEHVFAFLRQAGDHAVLVVVPRLAVGLVGGSERELLGPDVWTDTRLTLPGGGMWVNLFTGERLVADAGLSLGQVLGHFPVALLERR